MSQRLRGYTAEQALAYLQDLPSDLSDNDGRNGDNEDDEAPTITAVESASSNCDSSDEDVPALSVRLQIPSSRGRGRAMGQKRCPTIISTRGRLESSNGVPFHLEEEEAENVGKDSSKWQTISTRITVGRFSTRTFFASSPCTWSHSTCSYKNTCWSWNICLQNICQWSNDMPYMQVHYCRRPAHQWGWLENWTCWDEQIRWVNYSSGSKWRT